MDSGPPIPSQVTGWSFEERLLEQHTRTSMVLERVLATLSHDLRSPLAVQSAVCQYLTAGLAGAVTPRQADKIGVLEKQVERLQVLVEALLDHHRDRLSVVPLHLGPCDLGVVARGVLADLEPQAVGRGIQLIRGLEGERSCAGDRVAVAEVLVGYLASLFQGDRPGRRVEVVWEGETGLRILTSWPPHRELGTLDVALADRILAELGGEAQIGSAGVTLRFASCASTWGPEPRAADGAPGPRDPWTGWVRLPPLGTGEDPSEMLDLSDSWNLRQGPLPGMPRELHFQAFFKARGNTFMGNDLQRHVSIWVGNMLRNCEPRHERLFQVGDVFVMLLPGLTAEEANKRMIGLLQRLQHRRPLLGGRRIEVELDVRIQGTPG